jgi:hypothetical protein
MTNETDKVEKCAVGTCGLRRNEGSRYCLLHAVFSPELIADCSALTKIDDALSELTFRDREILKLYTGIGDGYVYTLGEIAMLFKLFTDDESGNPMPDEGRVVDVLARGFSRLQPETLKRLEGPTREPNEEPRIAIVSEALLEELARQPEDLYLVSPRKFEEIIAYVLEQFGFKVELTRQTSDGGKDLIAIRGDEMGIETSYIVECKRYAPTNRVGVAIARALYGVKEAEGQDHAIVATTSCFTRGAVEFAERPEVMNLHLRDFEEICRWIRSVSGTDLPLRDRVEPKGKIGAP